MKSARSFLKSLIVLFTVALALVWTTQAAAAAPALLSLTPTSVTAGGTAFTLNISGMNFTPGATANWNEIPLATTYTSATELTAVVPASLIASAGTANVTLSIADETSSALAFAVLPPLATISILNPAVAVAGSAIPQSVNYANLTSTWNATPITPAYNSASPLMAAISATPAAISGSSPSEAALDVNPPAAASPAPALVPVPAPTPASQSTSQAASSVSVNPPAAASPAPAPATASQSTSQAASSVSVSTPAAASPAPAPATASQSTSQAASSVAVNPPAAASPAPAPTVSMTPAGTGSVSSQSTPDASSTPPVPTVTSMSPTSVLASSGSFTLTVYGTNFLPGAIIRWNYGVPETTTYVSSTEVTAVIPASQFPPPGSYGVSVVTTSGISPYLMFTINPGQPIITSLSPNSVTAGNVAFPLFVFGNYFDSTTVVYWGSTPLVMTHVGSVLTATVPASLFATAGTANITVTAKGGTSAPVSITILAMPLMISLSPASVPAGSATFNVTIKGVNFLPTSGAGLTGPSGNAWLGATYVSSTQLTVSVWSSLVAIAGTDDIYVYTPGGYGSTRPLTLTINPAPPAITSLSPSSITAGGAGFMLTITGTAITPDVTAMWGSSPLYTVYVSPTQVRASIPASMLVNSATGSITVTNSVGASAPSTFTINPAHPAICGLSPGQTTAGNPAFTLNISGEYFTSASIVKWGSTALATTYISQSQLTAVVPANLIAAAGTASISVTTSVGTSGAAPFTINPAVKITTTTLPAGTAGNNYAGSINVTGGSPGYTWTVTGLPASMSFFDTSGSALTITGTPVASGAISFQVSVQDTTGASAGPVNYTINVAAGPSGVNNGILNGAYVCLFQGSIDTDSTRWATLTSFQADGQGNFINGIFDTNSYDIGSASGTISGAFNIGADSNGTASIHTILTNEAAGIQTTQWTIAISGAAQPAQQFRMVESDDLGTMPSFQQGSANCYLATASAFASGTISGSSFAFALDGEDNSGNMKSALGRFSASGGTITKGYIDIARGGSAIVLSDAFTATYTAPDPASGRFTMELNGAGSSTGFTVYIIDASRMFILDNTSDDGEQAGSMRTQQQASYSGASIDGPFVLYLRGAEFNSSGNTPSGFYADINRSTGDGAGNMTINQSYANNAGVYSAGSSNGGPVAITFDPAHPGRASFSSASGTTWLYLFNNNSAFEMSVGDNGSLDSGWLEPQTQTVFTNAALAGKYLFGDLPQLNIEPTGAVGIYGVTGSGTINAALTITSRGNLSWDQSTSMNYSWDATAAGTGTFLIANGAPSGASCAVISATTFVCASQTDPAPSVQLIEQ
jgi:hypothetical protein